MEEVSQDKTVNVKPRYSKKKIIRSCLILIFGLSAGYFHYKHVSTVFENVYHFSHLSELEREMSFRSEMGFYYSYYKTIVQEHPFIAGISKLMYDRLVEYPKDVNAFNRFNIHQEVIIGGIYRYFEPWLNRSAYRQCHMVDRGGGLSPVESCVGIGHPIFFYLEAVWVLAGLLAAVIFLHATLLSESIIGGLVAILQYFANHAEGTRVQWSPNERENFAVPLLFMQMWFLTQQLRERQRKTCFELQISIFILNCLCLLFWQFTQFIFLTQTAIFFVMEQLRIIDLKTLCVFLHSHFCGLHMAVLLLQGNDMLKSSMYASFFIVVSTYCLFFSSLRIKVKTRVDFFVESWLILLRISIAVVTSLYLKKFLGDFLGVEDDQHIWDLLYSKFTNYESFHTLIYTCSAVFDFLPFEDIVKLTKTFLIPFVLFACVNIVTYWFLHGVNKTSYYYAKSEKEKQKTDETDASEIEEMKTENEKDEKVNENEEENNETDDSGIENNENGNSTVVKKKRFDLDDFVFKIEPQKKEFMNDPFMLFVNLLDIDPAIFYNISQMCVFGLMAVLFMRLKLLFVTQMCIVSSLAASTKYVGKPSQSVMCFLVGLAGLVLHRLYQNMSTELSNVGEFRDVYQEELLLWISKETNPGAVFAGSMPILATVMLSTRRAIVIHPHYEHVDTRARTYAVYKTYGRFSSYELYQELTKLKATYLIVEKSFCYGNLKKGCSFQSVWDVEAPAYKGRPLLCHTLFTQPTEHLYKVFVNPEYAVFRVHDLSVRYIPRVFDT